MPESADAGTWPDVAGGTLYRGKRGLFLHVPWSKNLAWHVLRGGKTGERNAVFATLIAPFWCIKEGVVASIQRKTQSNALLHAIPLRKAAMSGAIELTSR